jgi:hypothetical protein
MNFSDITERQRFELIESGLAAFATYYRRGDTIVIPHVEAPVALRGTGTAGRLMTAIADYARDRQLKVTPLCPYARSWFKRHPDRADILA